MVSRKLVVNGFKGTRKTRMRLYISQCEHLASRTSANFPLWLQFGMFGQNILSSFLVSFQHGLNCPWLYARVPPLGQGRPCQGANPFAWKDWETTFPALEHRDCSTHAQIIPNQRVRLSLQPSPPHLSAELRSCWDGSILHHLKGWCNIHYMHYTPCVPAIWGRD